jgi:hypothetical protein
LGSFSGGGSIENEYDSDSNVRAWLREAYHIAQQREANSRRRSNSMKKPRLSLAAFKDIRIVELLGKADQKTLAVWAIHCAERVLPYFERKHPQDCRPENAIKTLQTWIDTGEFKMAVIRKASLGAHAAAREVEEDEAARSAAHSAGQAAATAHVPAHSIGAATYALQAIYRATNPSAAAAAVAKERDWQFNDLLQLMENDSDPNMQERLVAACGMNCAVCASYLAMKNDLKKKGFGKTYCAGCLPRGKVCYYKRKCDPLAKGRFCYECDDFPCHLLKTLDKRYRTFYHMSMIENLEFIRDHGIGEFLEKEATKWRCPEFGGVISCHNGLCYSCGLNKLRQRKHRYRWDED